MDEFQVSQYLQIHFSVSILQHEDTPTSIVNVGLNAYMTYQLKKKLQRLGLQFVPLQEYLQTGLAFHFSGQNWKVK